MKIKLLRNVKTHLTLNTLITDNEFEDAIKLAEYLNSIKYNQNLITLPEDRAVLDQVFLLSRAPLNDSRRLEAIIKWNNGSTFKTAKQGFQHYPHKLLLQQNPDPKMNLWIPNNLNSD